MKFINKFSRYYRTIKYLKALQISNRIYRRLIKPRFISNKHLKRSHFNFPKYKTHQSKNNLVSKEFNFLNDRRNLSFPRDWNNCDIPLLWTYNLHYFNDLMADNFETNLKEKHICDWIEHNPRNRKGPGWDPYTLSIRTVNWIKFFSKKKHQTESEIYSLLEQVRYLSKSLEYHLLGNHLLENAKALIFAGIFFKGKESEKWLNKGISIFKEQLDEQILDDGGHFELSPMYHSIMLDLVLDIYELTLKTDNELLLNIKEILKKNIIKMSNWLINIIHPDGEISYFNDAAIGIAKKPEYYLSRAESLIPEIFKFESQNTISLKNSGYYRISNDKYTILFDCAEIGASYLPGHGHADALSIEMSYLKQRVFVNLGTSIYESGIRREIERSTKSHSTLEVNDKNSSEVWSSFRVGRRAKILDSNLEEKNSKILVYGKHDGYKFFDKNLIHHRQIQIDNSYIKIIDKLNVPGHKGISRFHLHPEINIVCDFLNKYGTLILPSGEELQWKAECKKIFLEDSEYSTEFGILEKTKTLALCDDNFSISTLKIKIKK